MENSLTDLVMNQDINLIPRLSSHNILQSHISLFDNNTKIVISLPSFERSLAKL